MMEHLLPSSSDCAAEFVSCSDRNCSRCKRTRKKQLSEISPIAVIGKGSFGTVVLCEIHGSMGFSEEEKATNEVEEYSDSLGPAHQPEDPLDTEGVTERALDIDHLVAFKIVKYTSLPREQQVERRVLKNIDHPFIIKLKSYASTSSLSILGLEYCAHGDMFDYMNLRDKLSPREILPYAVELVLALSALHSKRIVHRDLKLENIGIGIDGHIRLMDFDQAYVFQSDDDTVITESGTLSYACPESLFRIPTRFEIDFWELGVVLFEMLEGYNPFDFDDDAEATVRRICTIPHTISLENEGTLLADVINGLLQKDAKTRMNEEGLRNHLYLREALAVPLTSIIPPFDITISTKLDDNVFKSFSNITVEDYCESTEILCDPNLCFKYLD